MKIINTIKKYFNTTNKNNFSFSSSDNILLKDKLEILDLKLKEQENLIQGLINYSEIKFYTVDTSNNANLGASEFSLAIFNNIVNMSGRLTSKNALSGQYYIDLPVNVRPKVGYVGYWANVIVDGTNYRFHIQVDKSNPSRLNIYSYDTFPAESSIVFQLTYALDNYAG